MKKMRKVFSIILTAMMLLAMAVPAMATEQEEYTITINNSNEGHTYEAYQVFKGNLSGDVLTDVSWGDGVNVDNLLTALKADATIGSEFTKLDSAAAVAEALAKLSNDPADVDAFAAVVGKNLSTASGSASEPLGGAYTISSLEAGYYFVKDREAITGSDASTKYILKLTLTDDDPIIPKSYVPSVEKKVKEDDKFEDTKYGTGYNDVADWNIGDSVPFKLIGTLPDNYADYDTYKYVFYDTASAGLTLDNNSIHVYVSTDKSGLSKTEISGWTLSTENMTNNESFTITFDNLKAANVFGTGDSAPITATSYIIVEYTATLNTSAEIGLPGNPNEVYLEFSNNPNVDGEGQTGTTPVDKVIVFTYELDTTKVDGENANKLQGAEFKLHDKKDKWVMVDAVGRVTGWTEEKTDGSTLISDSDGLFKVIGLDDGTYYLTETKAPKDYNKLINEIEVLIKANTINGHTWTSGTDSDALKETCIEKRDALTVKVNEGTAENGDEDKGIVNITVKNNKGATLPSTGGIGTTIFYAAGVILVLVAGVLLITKRRMNASR